MPTPPTVARRQSMETKRPGGPEDLADKAMQSPHYAPGKTRVGKRVFLPSSYSGSPRAQQQCYLAAMAMVRVKGKPDLFITMAASPAWPEVIEHLLEGQEPCDRPDLVARVFS